MTLDADVGATIRTVRAADVPTLPLGAVGTQQVLLGQPRGDSSPLLMGITSLRPGQTSALIEHDTSEIAYVLSGSGWMVTDREEHPFTADDAMLIEGRCWHAIRAGDDGVRMLYVFPTPGVPPTRGRGSAAS